MYKKSRTRTIIKREVGNGVSCNLLSLEETDTCTLGEITKGSRLMQISLLGFFKKIHKSALCELMSYALSYFISLVQFF